MAQAGTIVVDNMLELERLAQVDQETEWPMPELWLRYRPGVTVETHSHVQTGGRASKFGMEEGWTLCPGGGLFKKQV